MKKETILVTGAAGFIGYALVLKLLNKGEKVIGVDNLNDYYDVNLKKCRLKIIENFSNENNCSWKFYQISLEDESSLNKLNKNYQPDKIIHLAAQAGVRYSLINPKSYITSNLNSFFNILELCRQNKVSNFIFASSSSVYGLNKNIPFNEDHHCDHPISLYAATKKSNEVMAHSYSHLYKIPTIGLRFFTVYGPYGRPDMAPMIFADSILNSKPLKLFNHGEMYRDFTFIDDIIEGINGCIYKPATIEKDFDLSNPKASKSFAPFRLFNIGNSEPVCIKKFVELLENEFNKKAIIDFKPIEPGDVKFTFSDSTKIEKWINYKPKISIKEGIKIFAKWYLNYVS